MFLMRAMFVKSIHIFIVMPMGTALVLTPGEGSNIPQGRLYGAMCVVGINTALLLSGSLAKWQKPNPTVYSFDLISHKWEEHTCTGQNPLPLSHHGGCEVL